jgi:hypothetical protein
MWGAASPKLTSPTFFFCKQEEEKDLKMQGMMPGFFPVN